MTQAMQEQVQSELNLHSNIVSNFIDENEINSYRRIVKKTGPINYVFTGSLTTRKCPDLIVNAISKLLHEGHDVEANILGNGPLMNKLSRIVSKNNLPIRLHGNVSNPFELLADADVFVLPSLSEGISRSAMEALYLGVPCLMRNIDGNSELINSSFNNGELFNFNNELHKKMLSLGIKARKENFYKRILLPEKFRQHNAAKSFLEIITN
jgi:glycosyltransferase involved in cell wall biosynthesis